MFAKRQFVIPIAVAALAAGCSRSNNLLLGRVEAVVAGHTVVVTDCYRTMVPKPELLDAANSAAGARFVPCKDAEVVIRGEQLTVNGRSYGPLNPGATVVVDHGVVSVAKPGGR